MTSKTVGQFSLLAVTVALILTGHEGWATFFSILFVLSIL